MVAVTALDRNKHMNELPSAAVVISALFSGFILGLSLSTKVERKVRDTKKSLFTISHSASLFGFTLNQVFFLLIVSVFVVTAAVLIMRIGNAYPLSQIDRYAFVILWFASIIFAKYLRYCYWKNKN